MLTALVLLLQADAWTTTPPRPTVGDTVWVERVVAAPAGWRVRPGRLEGAGDVQPLGDPELGRVAGGWLVRYPVVAWSPGSHSLALPAVWRLGPDGSVVSLPGGAAVVTLRSVLPDTIAEPAARPALGPLRGPRRHPAAGATAAGLAVALLLGALRGRRRPPRAQAARPGARPTPPVPDAPWLAAGEPKAVAARAIGQLRVALARAIPAVALSLGTAECLAALERERPDAHLGELADVLSALDGIAFAAVPGADVARVAALAGRARALAADLAP